MVRRGECMLCESRRCYEGAEGASGDEGRVPRAKKQWNVKELWIVEVGD